MSIPDTTVSMATNWTPSMNFLCAMWGRQDNSSKAYQSMTGEMCENDLNARVRRHERAHKLMASPGLSRLDSPILWRRHGVPTASTTLSRKGVWGNLHRLLYCLYGWYLALQHNCHNYHSVVGTCLCTKSAKSLYTCKE